MKVYYHSSLSHAAIISRKLPGHLLFGASKLPQFGCDVIFHTSEDVPKQFGRSLLVKFRNGFNLWKQSRHCQVIYASTFSGIRWLIFLRAIRIFRKPIVVISYTCPKSSKGLKSLIFRAFYRGIDCYLLTSPSHYEIAQKSGYFRADQIESVHLGPDLEYYDEILRQPQSEMIGDFFSSGREERDFETVINSFSGRSEQLTIYAPKTHNNRNYSDYFSRYSSKISSNITITLLESILDAGQISAIARKFRWMLCCVLPTNYNTGYSTLQEAAGLGIPIVVSRNPYFGLDIEGHGMGFFVDYQNPDDLRRVLDQIKQHPDLASSMGVNARSYAKSHWNLMLFTEKLATTLKRVVSSNTSLKPV